MVLEDSKTNSNNLIKLDVVTLEQVVFSDFVDYVTVPGMEGELGILPHHCPLMTMLQPGELRIKKDNEEIYIAVGSGFLEVRPDRVIVLADMAERDQSIDAQKVEEAILRAKQASPIIQISEAEQAAAEASLRFELARLKVAEKQKRKRNLPALNNHRSSLFKNIM